LSDVVNDQVLEQKCYEIALEFLKTGGADISQYESQGMQDFYGKFLLDLMPLVVRTGSLEERRGVLGTVCDDASFRIVIALKPW
jgi:hypothetical protein